MKLTIFGLLVLASVYSPLSMAKQNTETLPMVVEKPLESKTVESLSSSVSKITIDEKGEDLSIGVDDDDDFKPVIVKMARGYFDTIDINKGVWLELSATKDLYFMKGGKEIVQDINITVTPLYEFLLFRKKDGQYTSGKLLEKTLKKQCERYVRKVNQLAGEDLSSYLKMANMTTNRVSGKLKSDTTLVVTFKCKIE